MSDLILMKTEMRLLKLKPCSIYNEKDISLLLNREQAYIDQNRKIIVVKETGLVISEYTDISVQSTTQWSEVPSET